ncbi:DNase I-like protein [Fomitiporia mediterranea MF3/22]|uniref:DNase I-like protein n=1 Tax=Fomitiporia mediterranea (strain MF3/22) TaxID=694068 RepID=UPI00044072F4|nr:DNase I-like protein [Fomitiporia mediterranea MF3/22]EJD01693.1 DNase I-like protein [Fomitiporia mediterranea MF3/22]
MDQDPGDLRIEDILNQLLGPSEAVKSTLTAQLSPVQDKDAPSTRSNNDSYILAVVSSSENVEEEGSVFIFRPVVIRKEPESDNELDYQLLATLPLTNALSISVAQSRARSGTIDLRPGKYAPASGPSFVLTLNFAGQKYVFFAESSEELGSFVSECRRLIKVADSAPHIDFRWLNKYHARRRLRVPALFPRPDLRKLVEPAHAGLSEAWAGQPGDEDADIEHIRNEWLRRKLDEDKSVFTGERNIRIRLGTFNVNGKTPSQDLSPWIRPQHNKPSEQPSLPALKSISPISLSSFTSSDYLSAKPTNSGMNDATASPQDSDPDILFLGFQELDLSTEALLYSYSTTREEMWLEAIFAALGEVRDQYMKLISKQLVGMLVTCLVKKELVKDITDMRTSSVGTGIMGVLGNKGAVALRLTLGSTVITVVNAHLAAFDENIDRRNSDFRDLTQRLSFISYPEQSSSEEAGESNSESIFQSDILFWMSDLNYRIDLSDTEVRELISGGPLTRNYDIRDLLSHDQLTKARLGGKSFENFREGEIRHRPSYRFSAGVATDPNGYDMKRRPAWTDRILYQVAPHVSLTQTNYDAHPELTMSDHKPVSAEFVITVQEADETVYYERMQELLAKVGDLTESDETPKMKIQLSEVQFWEVRHKRKTSQHLTLQNSGKIPCAFRFVSLSDGEPAFVPWLSAEPQMGIILPYEELSIKLTAYVDENSASALNVGNAQLQHTLILHTFRGKDHFIVVTGEYRPTCFANELETLVRLPGPIRETRKEKEPLAEKQKANAPREIMRLINWLMTNATNIPDLFTSHGDAQLEETIQESLDTGEEFNFDSKDMSEAERRKLALSFADVLFDFFQLLPSPLIPASVQDRCTQATDRDEAFEVMSSELPGTSVNVWISLTAFLHYLAQQIIPGEENSGGGTKASLLACIFAPVLLRDEPDAAKRVSPLAKRRFLLHFIQ